MSNTVSNKTLWESVLAEIESMVSKANFNTWFKDTFIVRKNTEGIVVVGVPNNFVKLWLTQKFTQEIIKHLRELDETVRGVEYTIAQKPAKTTTKETPIDNSTFRKNTLPLEETLISKQDNLNPRYTFDSFVIGPFNELAHAASQAIIKQPGIVYNPLFIYGNTGLGKTHLTQAIGNHIKQNYRDKQVYYMTSEQFATEYISALQSNKVQLFKDRYKKYDVLIMDDIQFFSNKEKTQEELFHLFNTLYENNKQIIFSSDQHPNYIPGLEDRLKSRFSQGMIVDIPKPDFEARSAILRSKANALGTILTDDVVTYLAETISTNVRELEGVLNSVICQSELKNRALSLEEVKSLVKGDSRPNKNISAEDLIKIVADFYKIDPLSIPDKTRKKEVVRPRQIAIYIMRERFSVSYPTIGEKLGNRDHTTMIHSYEKIKRELLNDQLLAQQIEQINAMI